MIFSGVIIAGYVKDAFLSFVLLNYGLTLPGGRKSQNALKFRQNSADKTDEELTEWMTKLPEPLRKVPIWNLTIPGSHDSGSYGLETKSGIAPDKPDLRNKWYIKWLGFIAFPIVKRWTVTQSSDIMDQLNHGIRYFDLRAASKIQNENLFFVHGLYGPEIMDMCQDINTFLSQHPREVVIIHVQHFIDATTHKQCQLLKQVTELFGTKICPFKDEHKSPTLDELASSKYQVFLFYPNNCEILSSKELWPPEYLPNPWANTTSASYLKQFLTENVSKRHPDRFYVTQGVLTPSDGFIRTYLLSSLYGKLVLACNKTLSEWLDQQEPGPKGPNIVMTDFVNWNDYYIPRTVVRMNYKNLKNKNEE